MNKLKRYALGRVTLAKTENSSLQGAGIVECDHGEFYRCADIDPLLESIGAGGVSGRITSKTLEQHRAEFELWLSNVETRGAADFERYMEDEFYMDWDVQRAWISWKAARGITE